MCLTSKEPMVTKIESGSGIEADSFWKKNQDNIILWRASGYHTSKYDDIIAKCPLVQSLYNMNEYFIFRTNHTNEIIIYHLYEDETYFIELFESILNISSILPNYYHIFTPSTTWIIHTKSGQFVDNGKNDIKIIDFAKSLSVKQTKPETRTKTPTWPAFTIKDYLYHCPYYTTTLTRDGERLVVYGTENGIFYKYMNTQYKLGDLVQFLQSTYFSLIKTLLIEG